MAALPLNANTPRFAQLLASELARANATRMLVFCALFALLEGLLLIVNAVDPSFFVQMALFFTTEADLAEWLIIAAVNTGIGLVCTLLYLIIRNRAVRNPHANEYLRLAVVALLAFLHIALCVGNPVVSIPVQLVFILCVGCVPALPREQSAIIIAVSFIAELLLLLFLPAGTLVNLQPYVLCLCAAAVASTAVSWTSWGLIKKRVAAECALEQRQQQLEAQVEARTEAYRAQAQTAEAASLAKTRFLTRISHEMRTAINTISGMAFLARESENPENLAPSLEAIEQATQKLTGIVNHIIDTAKIEADFAGDDFNQEFSLLMASSPGPPAAKENIALPDLSGRAVLIVEDLETNRLVLREYLKDTQATIDEAFNGREALELFAASPVGHYCFVFMDLLMPEMNGHEATRAIRALDRSDAVSVPIVAVSANAFKEDIEESLASGMDAHLAKPLDRMVLFTTIQERLGND